MIDLGFPIAEVAANGDCVITKHPGTGVRERRHRHRAVVVRDRSGALCQPGCRGRLHRTRVRRSVVTECGSATTAAIRRLSG